MIAHLTESKPQCYRAVAIFEDGRECLIYLGLSNQKVREGYEAAYNEIFEADEKEQVSNIELQQWNGAPDAGKWMKKTSLRIPNGKKAAIPMLVKVA